MAEKQKWKTTAHPRSPSYTKLREDRRLTHIGREGAKAGQNAQALPIINRALAVNPKTEGGLAQKALILSNLSQPDSVLAVLNTCAAVPAPYDKQSCAQVALKAGSDAYKTGNASKARPDLQRAVQFLLLSDKIDGSADAKFLAGA